MKKMLPFLVFLVFQGTALAVTSHLEFTVDSHASTTSGPGTYSYICGVGYRHGNGAEDAYNDIITWGYIKYNFIDNIEVSPYGPYTNTASSNFQPNDRGPTINNYSETISHFDYDGINPMEKSSYNLFSLNLSSEFYGGEWYIDVCHYRNSEVDQTPWNIKAEAFGANGLPGVDNYIEKAEVTVVTITSCDGSLIPEINNNTTPMPPTPGLSTVGNFATTGTEYKCITRFNFKENSTAARAGNLQGSFGIVTEYDAPIP